MVKTLEEETCGSCRFYMASPKVCRRYPPVPMMIGIEKGIGTISSDKPLIVPYFPTMMSNGWCGEWQAENPPDAEN